MDHADVPERRLTYDSSALTWEDVEPWISRLPALEADALEMRLRDGLGDLAIGRLLGHAESVIYRARLRAMARVIEMIRAARWTLEDAVAAGAAIGVSERYSRAVHHVATVTMSPAATARELGLSRPWLTQSVAKFRAAGTVPSLQTRSPLRRLRDQRRK